MRLFVLLVLSWINRPTIFDRSTFLLGIRLLLQYWGDTDWNGTVFGIHSDTERT
jgi:hypothetical protein